MIPKVIHYCWFGKNKKPKSVIKCIKSWKRYCPDFEIIEWNEDNSDFLSCLYAKQAFENKKWAFVADYVRLKALFENGGLYFDTDYELIRPIDIFYNNSFFIGFETVDRIAAGIMGCDKGFPFLKEWLNDYLKREFVKKDGSFDLTTNVSIFTKMLAQKGFELNNKLQVINGIFVYPSHYFYPLNYQTNKIFITKETYGIHHYDGSWMTGKDKFLKTIGPRLTKILVKIKHIFRRPKNE